MFQSLQKRTSISPLRYASRTIEFSWEKTSKRSVQPRKLDFNSFFSFTTQNGLWTKKIQFCMHFKVLKWWLLCGNWKYLLLLYSRVPNKRVNMAIYLKSVEIDKFLAENRIFPDFFLEILHLFDYFVHLKALINPI